ncbi:MAG: hypothetical protein K0R26_613 [Bacteroidota bacterium]|jgi:glycosyltransferase involved in cell wall biosynthesis|nr:hypothetical protein [Bacteroidota bacterium]
MASDLKVSSPQVSVVMSVYNGGAYLKEAIESVLNQSFSDFEFIIINDGSVDNSLSIIKEYSDPRIVLINNETNKGLIYSLNRGITQAKGEFIARMDADDICLKDRLDLQVSEFLNHPDAVVVGSDYFLLNDGKSVSVKNINDSDYQKAVLIFAPCFCHPTVMIRNLFKEKGIMYHPDFIHAEDYKLWTDLYNLGSYLNVSKPLLKYRHHPSQISNRNNESQLSVSWRIRKEYLDRLTFSLSDKEFATINLIGNNTPISSITTLKEIEVCLLRLNAENEKKQRFNRPSFNRFLFKFWLDSCGNTNLGVSAFRLFFSSQLASYGKLSFTDKNIFLMKCLIRRFRK